MHAILRWISLRHAILEPGRTLLVLVGIAVGVGVFVSIRLANRSAMGSFAETVDAVAGKANLQVRAQGGGFDERLLDDIRSSPGVQAAAPVVQVSAAAAGGAVRPSGRVLARGDHGPFSESLLVLGLDLTAEAPFGRVPAVDATGLAAGLALLSDPRGIALTATAARRLGVATGDRVTLLVSGRPEVLNVRLLLQAEELQQAAGGSLAVMGLAAAQDLFRRGGRLDRIDLLVEPSRRDEVQARLRRVLPSAVQVDLPEGRSRQVESMVRAFALNLTALSFIALFVAMFLIFNAVSMSVVRRRQEIGMLRSLGLTRGQVVGLFVGEALFLGVLGSAVGLLVGTLLARFTLAAIGRSITSLYLQVYAHRVIPDEASYLGGLLLGVAMSGLAALAPAVEASTTPPGLTTRQGAVLEARPLPVRSWAVAGVLLLLLAGLVAGWTVTARHPEGGFVSAFLLLLGFSLIAPAHTLLGERLLSPLAGRAGGVEGRLAARYLVDALARASVVVAALMVSVGLLIGLSVMVDSFRKTVQVWVNQTLRGDLYVEPAGRSLTASATALDPEFVARVRALPGVEAVDTYRSEQVTVNGRLAALIAIEFEVQAARGRLHFTQGEAGAVLHGARERSEVIVTESFAFRHRVDVGDRVELPTPTGSRDVRIAGVFYDYTTDAGAILMDAGLYRRLWGSDRTESLALYLRPGLSPDTLRPAILSAAGPAVLLSLTSNRALRRRVMTIFDQTFRITYALQAITVWVAVLGVINSLTALITQRAREIGILRAVGAEKRQVRKMVLWESGLLGLLGSSLGLACGLCLALLLTFVINKQFFGWSIRFALDPLLFGQTVLLIVGSAVLAGLAPARLAAGRLPAEAMRVD